MEFNFGDGDDLDLEKEAGTEPTLPSARSGATKLNFDGPVEGLEIDTLGPQLVAEEALKTTPQKFKQEKDLARKTGLPVDTVAADDGSLANQVRAKETVDKLAEVPAVSAWYTRTQSNANSASQDTDYLVNAGKLAVGLYLGITGAKEVAEPTLRASASAGVGMIFGAGEFVDETTRQLSRASDSVGESVTRLLRGDAAGDRAAARNAAKYAKGGAISAILDVYDASLEQVGLRKAGDVRSADLIDPENADATVGLTDAMKKQLVTIDDVIDQPFSSVVPFIIQTGIVSGPEMYAAAKAIPFLVIGKTGTMASERAKKFGREVTFGDYLTTLPYALSSALLERFAVSRLIPKSLKDGVLKEVGTRAIAKAAGKAAVIEGIVTEPAQTTLEYLGTTLGTGKLNLEEYGKNILGAVVGGTGLGGGIRTFTAVGESKALAARIREKADNLQSLNNMESSLRDTDPEAWLSLQTSLMEDSGVDGVIVSDKGAALLLQEVEGLSADQLELFNPSTENSATGVGVTVTPEQFWSLPKAAIDKIAEHVSFDGTQMSAVDAEEVASLTEMMSEQGFIDEVASVSAEMDENNALFVEIEQSIMQTGGALTADPAAARSAAQQMAAVFTTMAKRTGVPLQKIKDRFLPRIERGTGQPAADGLTQEGGFEAYRNIVDPEGRTIPAEDRPNLRMGDMYGMLPKDAEVVGELDDVILHRGANGDYYATAYNADLGEQDVVGFIQGRENGTELAVVEEMQGKGIGSELQYLFRRENPLAPTGGLTEAGASRLESTYDRLAAEYMDPLEQSDIDNAELELSKGFKDERIPELEEAARQRSAGEITQEAYDAKVNELKPIRPYTSVPAPATVGEMKSALKKGQQGRVGQGSNFVGEDVGMRLDIPAYTNHGTWVPTMHNPAGKPIAHEAAAQISDVVFTQPGDSAERKAARVGTGEVSKSPFAQMNGTLQSVDPDQLAARAAEVINDPEWTQVGYDPRRHTFFYDRATQQPVLSADEVIQVGPLVLAKNAQFGAGQSFLFQDDVEAVGEFSLKEDAKGFATVYGDVEDIRAALPDGIRGTVVPGGLRFTPNFAPRVAASLRGDETAFSRAGKVVQARKNKAGKYIGASAANNTAAKRTAWRKQFNQLALEGESGRFWYENSGAAVLELTGGDIAEAKKFIALLAIYSPQAKVSANSTFALRAWAQYKAGDPISVKTGVQDGQASAVLYDGTPWKGEKTNNFYINLLRQVDLSVAGKQGATIDMWMMHAGGYNKDYSNSSEYAFMENETNYLANELGWEPQQVQAAVWVAIKARMENPEVKRRTEEISAKRGWIHYEQNAKGKTVRVVDDERKHFGNWFKQGMAHDVTTDDTKTAKFDFADGIARHTGQISWEARPSTSVPILEGVHDAPYEQQLELQLAIMEALSDADGADRLAQYLGILADGSIVAPGVWEGDISPSAQATVAMAPAAGGFLYASKSDSDAAPLTKAEYDALSKADRANYQKTPAIDLSQQKTLKLYTSVLGLLLRQDGVGYHKPFLGASTTASNGMEFLTGQSLTPAEAQLFNDTFDLRMQEAGFAGWEYNVGLISSAEGMRVVSFDTSFIPNKKLHAVAEAAFTEMSGSDSIRVEYFATDGGLAFNDWKENPDGQDYIAEIKDSGRPDVLGWAGDVLYPEIQKVYADFSSRYGWGAAGQLDFFERGEHRQPAAFEQQLDSGARGSIEGARPTDVQDIVIRLYKSENLSTFLHESGHLYLKMLGTLASDATAPQQVKDDFAGVLKFLDVKSEGEIGTAQHEKWAETYEQYLRDGKAPSQELRSAFSKFSAWLTTLYRSIKSIGTGSAALNKDIAGVMDRLLATDEQIANVQSEMRMAPMFKDAEAAGMTDDAFAEYKQRYEDARDAAREELVQEAFAETRRERTKWWREELKTETNRVLEGMDTDPAWRTRAIIQAGVLPSGAPLPEVYPPRMKLNKAATAEYGHDLPGGNQLFARDGVSPDRAAQDLGYETGDQMLYELSQLPKDENGRFLTAKQFADQQAQEYMLQEHGDIMNPDEMHEEALMKVHSRRQAQVILDELRLLNRKAGGRDSVTNAAARNAAEQAMSEKTISEIESPTKYLNAERRFSMKAAEAVIAGDIDAALRFKTQQLLNFHMYRTARDMRMKADKMIATLNKRSRQKMDPKRVEPSFITQIKGMVSGIDFSSRMSQDRQASLSAETLQNWADQQSLKYGATFHISPALDRALSKMNVRDFTFSELEGLHDTVKSVYTQGLRYADAQNAQFNSIVQNMGYDIDANAKKKVPLRTGQRTKWEGAKSFVRLAFAEHRHILSLSEELDGYEQNGSVYSNVYQPIKRADDRYIDRSMKAAQTLNKILRRYTKSERLGFLSKKYIPELRGTSNPNLSRNERLAFGLNMGNAGNVSVMKDTYSDKQIDAVMATLTDKDWDVIESIWEHVDSYWNELSSLEERTTGVKPAKVDPSPFELPSGRKIKGGYYPLMADPNADRNSKEQYMSSQSLQSFSAGGKTKVSTKHGSTIERQGFGERPVWLDLRGLFEHIDGVVKDIEMREAVADVSRIIRSKPFEQAVKDAKGFEFYEMFNNWLENTVGASKPPITTVEKMSQYARTGASIAEMGLSVRTVLMQPFGFTNTVALLGEKYAAKGLAEFIGQRGGSVRKVMEASAFMRNRSATFNRDVREANRWMGVDSLKQDVVNASFWGIQKLDMAVSIPSWLGAYQKSIDEGRSHDDAVDFADQTVSRGQGSGLPRDMADIQQGPVWKKMFTMFYSYFGAYQNMQADQWKQTNFKNPAQAMKYAKNQMWITIIPSIAVDALFNQLFSGDDDEMLWAKIGGSIMKTLFGGIVFVRDVANLVASGFKFDYQLTPAGNPIKEAGNLAKQIGQGEIDTPLIKSLIMTAGYMGQIPGTRQASRAYSVVADEDTPFEIDEFESWFRVLVTGPKRD